MLWVGRSRLAFAAVLVLCAACSSPSSRPPASAGESERQSPDNAGVYAFEALTFSPSTARLRGLELTLEEPDATERPTAWEGPLRIRNLSSGAACVAEPSLITRVFLDTAARTAVVLSYSGSRTFVDFVDTADCRAKWPRIEAATDGAGIEGDRLTILPACERDGTRSRCSSGQVLRLRPEAPPEMLESESAQLTRGRVGVAFVGQAWIEGAGTSTARVVDGR